MNAREQLFDWLNQQDLWQQDLARRLAERPQLGDDEFAEALLVVKHAFDALPSGDSAPDPRRLSLEDLPTSDSSGAAPRLLSFGHLSGVGSAASDYAVRFAKQGLTIVYGQNAAGKTTYVRALKRVCRSVDGEATVLGNVFDDALAPQGPTAKIEILTGSNAKAQRINLSDPDDLGLTSISIFDARSAELYVDAGNAIAYVPSALLLLARLAVTQDQMRSRLLQEVGALEDQAPVFPEIPQNTAAHQIVTALSSHTDLTEVSSFAHLSSEEKLRLVDLRALVATAKASTARTNAEAARGDDRQATALAERLRELASHIAQPAVKELHRVAADADAARKAVELAASELGNQPIPGVGGDPWRALWGAAREFAESATTAFPPSIDERCPLCMQQITAESADRMAHFEEHITSTVQARERAASSRLLVHLEALAEHHVAACRSPFFETLKERDSPLYDGINSFLQTVSDRMAGLRENPYAAEAVPVGLAPVETLERWANARSRHAEDLVAAQDPERERALTKELAELEAREILVARLADVGKRVQILGQAEALRRAHGALATNRLTTEQKRLSERVVAGALDSKLKEELNSLRCSLPVDLHPRTRVGETEVGLRLAGAHGAPRVSDIASEGEQRALSLAFFLAEVAASDHDGGIVLDDPVSSLDDERRAHIAERVVAEAERRQVVVFTHDLPFLLDLQQQASDAGLEPLIQHVWRLGNEVGRVDDHAPFKAMKLRDRLAALTTEVEAWDKQDPPHDFDEAWRRVSDFYARLRNAWERAVEEGLFKGVVQRFQRDIKTLALDSVVVTPEMKSLVKDGMTRCSTYMHDEPPAASVRLPERAEIAADVEKLRDFVNLTKQR